MGICNSKANYAVSPEEKRQNKAIEKELRDEKRSKEQRVILLLLGAGESGKSTFAKQMKILFLDGYTEEELSSYRNIIRSNCIMGMRTLLLESQKRELYDGLPKNLKVRSIFFFLFFSSSSFVFFYSTLLLSFMKVHLFHFYFFLFLFIFFFVSFLSVIFTYHYFCFLG